MCVREKNSNKYIYAKIPPFFFKHPKNTTHYQLGCYVFYNIAFWQVLIC